MKEANLVIIGGTIAAGKSTLVSNLAKATGWQPVPELRDGDKLQEIILNKMYEGTRIHNATIQGYFITNRYMQYKEYYNQMITSILDRGIWEDLFFATLWLGEDIRTLKHYKVLWRTTITKLIEKYGKPKAYIYLTVDWRTFKERIYTRNRESEVQHFSKNESFFKNLLDVYNKDFITLLKEFDIDAIVIDTVAFNKVETLNITLEKLKSQGILED